ncbi:hypothetical protein [Caldithrix abyssi]|uniref:Uncharacterized protein n=1 Tax=Caldithrix abyssi DSM 13497 TaxID=880073 RepID=H1XRY0_CALAY|nr:hypothetical protein [Caldithrix abyssi]APF18469.1 hypothetical protein Cabys_1720 [Caldithrix abyssi DSM 13497]EHO42473.1 hypothetical protein Calab_2866 [Caldithrix abyssi DSM 13497]
MDKFRGKPSAWLLKNSKGFPDFLFTILTYSMILLIFLMLIWIAFAILAFIHAGSPKAVILIQIMDSMKTGLISLAGVVFGLAGSYTVRRFKTDDHYLQKKRLEIEVDRAEKDGKQGLQVVEDQEDI